MSQESVFGGAAITAYIKVNKADGRVMYFLVADGKNIEITQKEYEENA